MLAPSMGPAPERNWAVTVCALTVKPTVFPDVRAIKNGPVLMSITEAFPTVWSTVVPEAPPTKLPLTLSAPVKCNCNT